MWSRLILSATYCGQIAWYTLSQLDNSLLYKNPLIIIIRLMLSDFFQPQKYCNYENSAPPHSPADAHVLLDEANSICGFEEQKVEHFTELVWNKLRTT
jgi:hypothetical protein